MELSDEAKKYRRKNSRFVVWAAVIGGYFGGLTGLITWMALARKSPRPTLPVVLLYAGVGLIVVGAVTAWVRRREKKEREKPQ